MSYISPSAMEVSVAKNIDNRCKFSAHKRSGSDFSKKFMKFIWH